MRVYSGPYDDFQALLSNAEMEAERLRSRFKGWGLDATINVETISVDGASAIKMTTTVPGKLKQILISFLRAKSYYTFAYGGPPDLFNKFLSIVMMSIESFEPIIKDMSKEDAIRHIVTSKLRTAKLYIQTGQIEWAIQVINEGLQIAPENEELLELKKQLEKR